MATLEKRIAALERTEPASFGPMFIHFVGVGETDKEIQAIEAPFTGARQRWERLPGETEEGLKNRAKSEATPLKDGRPIFLCT